ncbi:hypothetical protein CH254_22310 [Rhodococcus sp. 06-412-2C]|uniref:DUF4012 domain-containing protein n=1 Tax=unclassified Rhodococcus (in: high G+C Gram-positive bacteria) TaxID=192944 RepID=UPI000B9B3C54|nr:MULTISPECIES: DUF4012 domain-containing protein [unclassified Rhodococcus (in: high G+C Gram-positive bacteria)]OZC83666.1 hypothetical protein CH254_22310 [Rhodococcus sp. 06-412-2C]OZC93853.1 hypothetical protein CH279_20390 [Rhodococcus sp. 06-412-2B]
MATSSTDTRGRKSGRKRPILITVGVFLVIVIAFVVWLGYESYSAQSSLTATRDAATQAKDALLDGDSAGAEAAAARASESANDAVSATTSIPFSIATAVPYLGSPLKSVAQISDVVQGLAVDVLAPASAAGASLNPSSLVEGGGKVDTAALRDAQPVLQQTSAAADELSERAQQVDEPAFLGVVDEARTSLIDQTHELANLLTNTRIASELLPSMLGDNGPRSYFLAFQTNAEARGTGGLLGGYGIIRAENGTARVDTLGANNELEFAKQPIDLGPEYNALWAPRNTTIDFRNSNASPHFPYAGQIWSSMWTEQTGEMLNGAIATDPIALSYILGATGPVTLADGEQITAENVVDITLSTAYSRFGDDQLARKAYLQEIAAAVVQKMTTGAAPTRSLLDAVGRAGSEGRISVWSADPAEQAILASTKVGHVLPDSPAPFADVVVNNAGGNKLDYYLTRDIKYSAESCTAGTRKSTVTATLTNNVDPTGLTPYVASTFQPTVEYGTNESIVYLYGTQGAKITSMKVNGITGFSIQAGTELGRPVQAAYLTIPPGKSQTVTWELEEPSAPGEATVPVQPLVDQPTVSIDVPEC